LKFHRIYRKNFAKDNITIDYQAIMNCFDFEKISPAKPFPIT
jgi:hypothetical protein